MELEQVFIPLTVSLPNWGDYALKLIITPDGPFYMIRQLCTVLGITDVPNQITQLRDRRSMTRYVKQFRVKLDRGGVQSVWCIHRRAVAFWFGQINDKKVRSQIADKLVELQEEIMVAADRILFGEIESTSPILLDQDVRRFALKLEERVGHLEHVALVDKEED